MMYMMFLKTIISLGVVHREMSDWEVLVNCVKSAAAFVAGELQLLTQLSSV